MVVTNSLLFFLINTNTAIVNSSLAIKFNIVIYFIRSIAWKNQSGYIICPGIIKNVAKRIAEFSLNFDTQTTNKSKTIKANSINIHLAQKTLENISETRFASSRFFATSRVAV